MPKTRNTLQLKNLATYDVFIEDTSSSSPYFKVTNLPPLFTGGRNSFLIAGSSLLQFASEILVEIIDADGNTIFQNPVKDFLRGESVMVSVEVNELNATGFATIILLGSATVAADGTPIPPDWQDTYNVRWTSTILVDPQIRNSSPIVFKNIPQITSEENRLHNIASASYTSSSVTFTASLSPILDSGYPVGYTAVAQSPTTFSADYDDSYITGSLLIGQRSASLYLPTSDILNDTTLFTVGNLIKFTDGNVVEKIYLYSGSYNTPIQGISTAVTSSATLVYRKLNASGTNIPISYANLRITDLNTVSGEIYKLKVYSKVATNFGDYKLIADIPVSSTELLTSQSIRGYLPIGDFNVLPSASASWYSDRLEKTSNILHPISGSSAYYDSTTTVIPYTLSVTDNVLLRAMSAYVPVDGTVFSNVSESGYFIGTREPITVFANTEYTLQLDAYYRNESASINLTGNTPSVDIYLIGTGTTKVIDDDPLGQKIGTLTIDGTAQTRWFQDEQFNFNPAITDSGTVGLRFAISNGFWHFSEISLKPASDELFAPDEIQLLVPNTEYHNEFLQHKVEFLDINSNSTELFITSQPTFFTGSNIDLGTLS